MDASQILVIILSIVLAIFLVLAIILTVYLIVIARKIRNVANSAERTASQLEGVAGLMRKAVAPAVISKFAVDIISRFVGKRNKKNKKGEDDE